MPFGIVTGFTEVEHITPHNLKALNAAVAGSGNYVLKIGKQLQASMQTANQLRVLDGYGMMGGAQWGMEPGEYVDLTIDNGTQGMNRIDLVVARYDRTGAKNIESVTLRVIKGTPSSGTPSVPAFVTGDILAGAATAEMPLYKVQLSGLTVAAPVAMFEVLTPSKDAWDSVSQTEAGWRIVRLGSITIASYSYDDMIFSGGNEYMRMASVPLPAGFSSPPIVLMDKCGDDNTVPGVSAIPRVTNVRTAAVDIAFTASNGSLPTSFKQAFSLIAMGM